MGKRLGRTGSTRELSWCAGDVRYGGRLGLLGPSENRKQWHMLGFRLRSLVQERSGGLPYAKSTIVSCQPPMYSRDSDRSQSEMEHGSCRIAEAVLIVRRS